MSQTAYDDIETAHELGLKLNELHAKLQRIEGQHMYRLPVLAKHSNLGLECGYVKKTHLLCAGQRTELEALLEDIESTARELKLEVTND